MTTVSEACGKKVVSPYTLTFVTFFSNNLSLMFLSLLNMPAWCILQTKLNQRLPAPGLKYKSHSPNTSIHKLLHFSIPAQLEVSPEGVQSGIFFGIKPFHLALFHGLLLDHQGSLDCVLPCMHKDEHLMAVLDEVQCLVKRRSVEVVLADL